MISLTNFLNARKSYLIKSNEIFLILTRWVLRDFYFCACFIFGAKCLFTTAHQTLDKYKITVQNVATVFAKCIPRVCNGRQRTEICVNFKTKLIYMYDFTIETSTRCFNVKPDKCLLKAMKHTILL